MTRNIAVLLTVMGLMIAEPCKTVEKEEECVDPSC